MLENLTDKQLAEVATSAEGKQVLSVIKESLAANIEYQKLWGEFLTPTKKVTADEQRIQRIDAVITEAAKTGRTKETQTGEVNPLLEDVKKTAELNKKLLEMINDVDPQPTGIKPHKLKSGKMSPGGAGASEAAASHPESLKRITDNGLKAKFERLGEKYGVPPSLIAGIASRESEMG